MMKIYLASKSPRRQELLKQMQICFDVIHIDTPEEYLLGETPEAYSYRITQMKLEAAWEFIVTKGLEHRPILCADTEVILDNQILGKPKDRQDAFRMLKSYSNREHAVLTSIGIRYLHQQYLSQNRTMVKFSMLSDANIQQYLDTEEYLDKAGAYGIQSSIAQFIEKIDGCFYSVIGLPLHAARCLLDKITHQEI